MTLQKANIKPQTSGSSAVANQIKPAEQPVQTLDEKQQTALEPVATQSTMFAGTGNPVPPPPWGTDNPTNRNNTQDPHHNVQTKLSIGSPDDEYEQQADEIANRVMTMPERDINKFSVSQIKDDNSKPTFQKKEEEEDEAIRKKQIFRKSDEAVNSPPSWLENQLNTSKGNGKSLPGDTMASMDSRFGKDFSKVQIHTDPNAVQMSKELGAQAFTQGNDIYFNNGKYNPENSSGKLLLAHELTHVVQNRAQVHLKPNEESPITKQFTEGQGMFQDDDYLVWGTWCDGDSTSTFFERVVPQWIIWRYGNVVAAGVYSRIMDYLRGLTKVPLQPVSDLQPGNQYFIWFERSSIEIVDILVNGDKATRENIRKEGGKKAEKREEQAGLGSAVEGRAAAKAKPETMLPDADKVQVPIPINESTYIPEKKTGLNIYHPNAEALPAKISGPDMQSLGGIGTYRMDLDYSIAGRDQLSQVVEAMNWVNYHWERFDITPMVEKGMRDQVEKEKKRQIVSAEAEVGKMEASGRRAGNAVSDIEEDISHSVSALADPIKASTTGDASDIIGKALANYESLELLPASVIISAGGVALGALADLMGGRFQEREIPWPKREGYFLIRCIAQPSPQGPNGEQQRYASVAVKTVEVREVKKLAVNALDMPSTQVKEKELELIIANQKQPPDPEEISQLTKELEYLKKMVSGSAQDVVQASIDKKEEELKTATGYRKQQLEDELTILHSQKELAEERVKGLQDVVRPQASFASKVTGETYPLLLQLGFRGMDGKKYVYALSDITSRDTRAPYVGKDKDPKTAAWNAVRDFAGHNDYGRGTIAIRLPEGSAFQFSQTAIESAPRDTDLVKKRLSDLVTILVVLGLFVPGVGEAAAVLGAGLAAEHLYARYRAGTLRFDASAVSDMIGVLGAVAVGMGSIAKFRLIKSADGFILASSEGEAKALQEAIEAMTGAQKFAQGTALGNKIFMAGGVIWGNLMMLNTIMETNQLELQGKISHAEARRRKAQAVMDGIQNNLLVIAAGMSGPKEPVGKVNEPQGTKKPGKVLDQPPRPANVHEPTAPSEQSTPKPGEVGGTTTPKDVSAPAVPPKEIAVPKDIPAKEPVPIEETPGPRPAEPVTPSASTPATTPAKPKVAASAVAADGINQITILDDGSIIRNSASLSEPLRNTYDEFLKSATGDRQALATELDNRLKAVEQKAKMEDPLAKQAAAQEAATLESDLRNFSTQSLAAETGINQKNMSKLTEVFHPDEIRVLRDILGPIRFRYFGRRSPQALRRLARAWSVSGADPVVRQFIIEIIGIDTRLITDSKMETALTDLAYMQAMYPGKFNMATLEAYLKYLRRGDIMAAKAELQSTIDVLEGKKPAPSTTSGKPAGIVESEGASTRGGTFTSATAQTEKSMTTSIRADIAEAEAYKAAIVEHNEIGLQRPMGANVPGTDFITSKVISGDMWVIVTDVKMSTIGEFPSPATTVKPAWMAEVLAAVAEGRLKLGNPLLEAQIRAAVDTGRVQMRQINVDYSPQGKGAITGF